MDMDIWDIDLALTMLHCIAFGEASGRLVCLSIGDKMDVYNGTRYVYKRVQRRDYISVHWHERYLCK
jgi:hypothetical protein